jgi:hypothetical protein
VGEIAFVDSGSAFEAVDGGEAVGVVEFCEIRVMGRAKVKTAINVPKKLHITEEG